jgi:hypothetical protein
VHRAAVGLDWPQQTLSLIEDSLFKRSAVRTARCEHVANRQVAEAAPQAPLHAACRCTDVERVISVGNCRSNVASAALAAAQSRLSSRPSLIGHPFSRPRTEASLQPPPLLVHEAWLAQWYAGSGVVLRCLDRFQTAEGTTFVRPQIEQTGLETHLIVPAPSAPCFPHKRAP